MVLLLWCHSGCLIVGVVVGVVVGVGVVGVDVGSTYTCDMYVVMGLDENIMVECHAAGTYLGLLDDMRAIGGACGCCAVREKQEGENGCSEQAHERHHH